MPRAKLTLSIPEGVWIGDLSRSHPETQFRILSALPDDSRGFGLVEVISTETEDVIADMWDADEIAGFDLLQRHDDVAIVQFETTEPFLLLPVIDSHVALEMPFELSSGEATWEITAPQERLSALGEQLEAFDIAFDVVHIHQHIDSEQLLTERQRLVVTSAVEAGYYDTPRCCSLTELADELDIAKSTCSETLHRAEEKIVKQFVGDEPFDVAGAIPR